MINEPLKAGCVVISRAGRDEGRYFFVLRELDDNHVLIADGDLRKADKPKKKKRKHLKGTKEWVPELSERLKAGECVLDHELRQALVTIGMRKGGKECLNLT